MANKLLNMPYAGCVWHWAQLLSGGDNLIEAHGRYQRRTFRTRTVIMAANGPLAISVPVESDYSKPYNAIRINYDTNWAMQHQRALLSAYNSTPFYEFYADDFAALYSQRFEYVWQLNEALMKLIAELMGVEVNCCYTDSYGPCPQGYADLRIAIEPKFQHLLSGGANSVEYYQVFAEKYGFTPGLSIFDLLFNMGPESKLVLRQMANGLAEGNAR